MMINLRSVHKSTIALFMLCAATFSLPAQAQMIGYDNMSFVEEPVAIDLGAGITADVSGLVDQSAEFDFEDDRDSYNTRANALVRAQTELPINWTVIAQYFASYDRLADEEYTDEVAVSISDEWGTISGGNVTRAVFEEVRRHRGIGNAAIELDDFYGGLDEFGAFYSVRHNAHTFAITADQEGRAEASLAFSRPVGQSIYWAGIRARKGNLSEDHDEDGLFATDGDTYGATLVASYVYTSWLIDAQIAYENIDEENGEEMDRIFGSIGTRYKTGALTLSAEGHLGDMDGLSEESSAIGARYDLARGLSLNGGYNYTDIEDTPESHTATVSVRYEY